MISPLVVLRAQNHPFRGKTTPFHLDGKNEVKALVKNNENPDISAAITHLSWYRMGQLGKTPWFEWVPSRRDIADLPTRKVRIPFKYLNKGGWPNLRPFYDLI